MTGKIKALGLALIVAILGAIGISAMSAPASSGGPEFHFGEITHLTGTQTGENALHTPAGNIKCTNVNLIGSSPELTATEGTFTPTYSGCTGFGLTTHIDPMGCTYRATSSEVIHLECPPGNSLAISVTQGGAKICHINVPPQTLGAVYTNEGGPPADITMGLAPETVLTYTVERTAGGSKCPTNGHHSDGVYTGTTTVTAYQDAEHKEQINVTYE